MVSRAWYVVAVIVLIAFIGCAGWVMWSGISGLESALVRVIVPGSSVLMLDEPGTYTIFHEYESVIDGKMYSVRNVNGLRISVTEETSGGAIAVTAPGASSRYSIGGHSGVSVFAFDIVRPGRYRLAAAYDSARSEPVTVLAIGQGFFGRLVSTILGTIALVFAGMIGAIAIVLTTLFRRRRMRHGPRTST